MDLLNFLKQSIFYFYLKNLIWNIRFWFFCKKIYKTFSYEISSKDFVLDEVLKMHYKKEIITKKRFVGYLFENKIYYDNPGFPILDRNSWLKIKKNNMLF